MSNITVLILILIPVLFSLHHSSFIPKHKVRNKMSLNSGTLVAEATWSYLLGQRLGLKLCLMEALLIYHLVFGLVELLKMKFLRSHSRKWKRNCRKSGITNGTPKYTMNFKILRIWLYCSRVLKLTIALWH